MQTGRDLRIDFFRGLALVFIFWDHIPHNPLGQVTPRNFGFSDAAEIFVFLAGYAAVLAYGKLLLRDGYAVACLRVLRRVWVLYVAHIFLLAVLMGWCSPTTMWTAATSSMKWAWTTSSPTRNRR